MSNTIPFFSQSMRDTKKVEKQNFLPKKIQVLIRTDFVKRTLFTRVP